MKIVFFILQYCIFQTTTLYILDNVITDKQQSAVNVLVLSGAAGLAALVGAAAAATGIILKCRRGMVSCPDFMSYKFYSSALQEHCSF